MSPSVQVSITTEDGVDPYLTLFIGKGQTPTRISAGKVKGGGGGGGECWGGGGGGAGGGGGV